LNDFWTYADRLVGEHQAVIDRPKGSRHPRYPDAIYPLDYGYLAGTHGADRGGVDVWIGSLPDGGVTGVVITADVFKRDAEVKLLLGCTPAEAELALRTHQTESQGATLVMRS
jgi:inorganic pyrophosphatase